jgi:CHAT domain-containing protein
LWDQKLSIPRLQAFVKSIGWNDPKTVPVDLLVLSACKTAIGDANAELGFAGLALATGVKSTLASLWSVSDLGTLALMSEFYNALGQGAGKAQALRKAQLQLLQGKVSLQNGKLITREGNALSLPPELAQQSELDLSHPYFWSSFMLFGNWH